MAQPSSTFEQAPPRLGPPQHSTLGDGGMSNFWRIPQSTREAGPRSNVYHVSHHGIADGIDANAATVTIRFQTLTGAAAPSRYVQTFADILPRPTLELGRIRTLLSEGLLREARAVIAEALKRFPSDESLFALSKLTALQKATRVAEKFQPRNQEFQWLDEHRDAYKGKWVALLGNEMVASGDTMKQVLDAMATAGVRGNPLVHKVR